MASVMSTLRTCLIGIFLVVSVSHAPVAQEATQGGLSSLLSPDQAKALSELLQDDVSRAAIIVELERIGTTASATDTTTACSTGIASVMIGIASSAKPKPATM